MDERYWIGRKRAAMAMARAATSAEARLIHYDLAGRYSVKAAFDIPFMMPIEGPATPGEGLALDRAIPALPRPRPSYRGRRGPGRPAKDGR
ncbi:MAG: hypothetical protein QOD42_1390 [Sphingomonadales bacterium]|jgi:hypothetical protein|nr:hypothetical protein [Sphingomonadales bacterium]